MTRLELIKKIRQWRREHGYGDTYQWAANIVVMLESIGLIAAVNEEDLFPAGKIQPGDILL